MKNLFYVLLFIYISVYSQNTTQPYIERKTTNPTVLTKLLNEKKWNQLFPNRHGMGVSRTQKDHTDFYSFKAFVQAAGYFPEFANSKNSTTNRRELAAFLANIAQETSGGWDEAPGGYFKWGLYFLEEQVDNKVIYADKSKVNYPPVEGKNYHGRGPKQLSWNYNYGQFSEAWFGNKNILLEKPEQLATNNVLSFASALWFWMTTQYPKPSCHDIMTGKWTPTQNDIKNGRISGFGATVNVINGGVECGLGKDLQKTSYRYQYYNYFCKYLKVSPGENVTCTNQKPFGQ